MKEFFKGWRRKVGCVTLAAACLFVAGWVRSTVVDDYVTAFNRSFFSSRGRFYLGPQFSLEWRSWAWDSGPGLLPPDFLLQGVPYSIVAIPLTLLSIYLILWPTLQRA